MEAVLICPGTEARLFILLDEKFECFRLVRPRHEAGLSLVVEVREAGPDTTVDREAVVLVEARVLRGFLPDLPEGDVVRTF